MNGECHFCHGIVSADESNHILLDGHGDHEVYLHRQCAVGHNVLEDADESPGAVAITCPKCGTVETH